MVYSFMVAIYGHMCIGVLPVHKTLIKTLKTIRITVGTVCNSFHQMSYSPNWMNIDEYCLKQSSRRYPNQIPEPSQSLSMLYHKVRLNISNVDIGGTIR